MTADAIRLALVLLLLAVGVAVAVRRHGQFRAKLTLAGRRDEWRREQRRQMHDR